MAEKPHPPVMRRLKVPGTVDTAEGVDTADDQSDAGDGADQDHIVEPELPGSLSSEAVDEAALADQSRRRSQNLTSKSMAMFQSRLSHASLSSGGPQPRVETRTSTNGSMLSKPRPTFRPGRTVSLQLEALGRQLRSGQRRRGSADVQDLIADIKDGDKESERGLDPWRKNVARMITHRYFQMAMAFVIGLNTVYVGIETDQGNSWAKNSVDGVEIAFVLIFFVEISLRLFVGIRRFFCGEVWDVCWNIFDLGLVAIAVFDLLILSLFFAGAAEDLEGFGVLRILRVLRVARVLRLLQFFEELWLLVAGVLDAMRSLVWAWVLICIIIYVFAVLITSTVGKLHHQDSCPEVGDDLGRLFGSVYKTMFTLFSVMTINGWGEIAKCAMEVEPWTWSLFVLFLVCTSFGMVNVITAVIVEGTLERALQQHRMQSQKEDAERRQLISQVAIIFQTSDQNQDGMLTREEFMASLEQPMVMRMLITIGIDVAKARNLFDILDYDCSGSLDLTEFLHGMLRARGEAASKDIVQLQCDVMRAEQRYKEDLRAVKESFFKRLVPVEMEIEAAHVEVKRLIRALEASASQSRSHSEPGCGVGPAVRGLPETPTPASQDTVLLSCSSIEDGYHTALGFSFQAAPAAQGRLPDG